MLKDRVEVIKQGDESGNEMVVRFRLASGLEILGLPTKNFYGGEWDLGPTWNYLVLSDEPFLVDTGRTGTSRSLIDMMATAGFSVKDLKYVMLSHGHEDHDGGLAEIAGLSGAKIRAHSIYRSLVGIQADKAPEGVRKEFPPSCWHCFMPQSFTDEYCAEYHQARSRLEIENLGNAESRIAENIHTHYLPGHSPDAVAVSLCNEAFLVGDNILPDITPAPSREKFFRQLSGILKPEDTNGELVFGLKAYIRSSKKLRKQVAGLSDVLILPGHRLFYRNQWNDIDPLSRIDEIIQHHLDRFSAILEILADGPKEVKEIVVKHFNESSIKGSGMHMAENEIMSHLELLLDCDDVQQVDETVFAASGSNNFEAAIEALEPF
ncbi:MAG: MBL fold metallo-hydrolase [Proteobacteria bacterium]|nr:MBL fold metallo-hydrolase [Pseudomonadota bacterium]